MASYLPEYCAGRPKNPVSAFLEFEIFGWQIQTLIIIMIIVMVVAHVLINSRP
jgi:hypothetical protein